MISGEIEVNSFKIRLILEAKLGVDPVLTTSLYVKRSNYGYKHIQEILPWDKKCEIIHVTIRFL